MSGVQTSILLSRLFYYGTAPKFCSKKAIVWRKNNARPETEESISYHKLCVDSQKIAKHLLSIKSETSPDIVKSFKNERYISPGRVAILDEGKQNYIKSVIATWLTSSAAVPLAINHPPEEWKYFLENSKPYCAIFNSSFSSSFLPLFKEEGLNRINTMEIQSPSSLQKLLVNSHRAFDFKEEEEGEMYKLDEKLFTQSALNQSLMIYTSGTTGKPKGVVLTHSAIDHQLESLRNAWEWSEKDVIANCLPLHHINGIVNVLYSSLNAGATAHLLGKFNVKEVWDYLIERNDLTVFMAVPTIYAKMYDYYEHSSPDIQKQMQDACRRLRLMVSGSAALPVPLLQKWEEMSSHRLLERYGMSEIGMALSNSYASERFPGKVGKELPFVSVRIVKSEEVNGKTVEKEVKTDGDEGELRVKSPTLFSDYWERSDDYMKSFDSDGWFKTGDIATRIDGIYQILGRSSVDILKVGGYKISALEIEFIFLSHPAILSCAIVGKPDEEYGQEIVALLVIKDQHKAAYAEKITTSSEHTETPDFIPESMKPLVDEFKGQDELKRDILNWAKEKLAPYKLPRRFIFLKEIPVNAMGKVNKKSLVSSFFPPK